MNINEISTQILKFLENIQTWKFEDIAKICLGYILFIWFVLTVWVFIDAKRRYRNLFATILITLLVAFPIVGFPFLLLYIVIRPEMTIKEIQLISKGFEVYNFDNNLKKLGVANTVNKSLPQSSSEHNIQNSQQLTDIVIDQQHNKVYDTQENVDASILKNDEVPSKVVVVNKEKKNLFKKISSLFKSSKSTKSIVGLSNNIITNTDSVSSNETQTNDIVNDNIDDDEVKQPIENVSQIHNDIEKPIVNIRDVSSLDIQNKENDVNTITEQNNVNVDDKLNVDIVNMNHVNDIVQNSENPSTKNAITSNQKNDNIIDKSKLNNKGKIKFIFK